MLLVLSHLYADNPHFDLLTKHPLKKQSCLFPTAQHAGTERFAIVMHVCADQLCLRTLRWWFLICHRGH